MKNYCNIGRAVLANAIGLQKNYKEEIVSCQEVFDAEATGCYQCMFHAYNQVAKQGDDMYEYVTTVCEGCPYKKYKTQYISRRVYHNEKNRYGYLPRLKGNAIKLFVAYHFMESDSFGLIRNVDLNALAAQLHCNVKTIHNNNESLRKYGYIAYNKVDTNVVNVLLLGYRDYFKPSNEGGRGYITISKSVFDNIKCIDSLNVLRLTVRGLMDCNATGSDRTISKDYKDLRRLLPGYCKRGIIQAALKKISVFTTNINNDKAEFKIKSEYDTKLLQQKDQKHYIEELTQYSRLYWIDRAKIINGSITMEESKYADYYKGVETSHDVLPPTLIIENDIPELAKLCVRYSFTSVTDAICAAYISYRSKHEPIANLPALVHTIIKEKNKKKLFSSYAF